MCDEYEFDILAARTHGRVYRRPPEGRICRLLLVGFHGYGESAEDLIRELDRIPGADEWSLAAIQGLHRLYNRRTGDVVASWMTRQDRDIAIADNLTYVGEALRRLRAEHAEDPPVVYVGFSQGTAMAYRAAAGIDSPCAGIIALGGDVPPELAEADWAGFPPVMIGRGDQDEWYEESKLSQDLGILASLGISHTSVEFSGGHEWTDDFRSEASRWIRKTVLSRQGESRSR